MYVLKPSLEFYRDILIHLNINISSSMLFLEEIVPPLYFFSYSYIFHNQRSEQIE